MCQQINGSRIQICTSSIDRLHDNFIQAFRQLFLWQVMLVLTDTNGLRINLDQLSKRIEQSSADGYCTSFFNCKIREFFSCIFLCRPYGSTCLRYDGILYVQAVFLNKFSTQLFRFAGSRTITDRNNLYAIFTDQTQHFLLCTIHAFRGRLTTEWEDLGYRQHLSCFINNSKLASIGKTRVKTKDNSAL